MTDIMFTRTALTEAAKGAGVTTDQARTILERAGVRVEPEKPALPTEPESVILGTEVRGVEGKWRMMLGDGRDWYSAELISERHWHRPDDITVWTEAMVVPVAAATVTLTEEQVGEVHEVERLKDPAGLSVAPFNGLPEVVRAIHTATVNAILAQYAAPAEGKPIDLGNMRGGDRVRVEFTDGDAWEVRVRVTNGDSFSTTTDLRIYHGDIRTIHLLHREEA